MYTHIMCVYIYIYTCIHILCVYIYYRDESDWNYLANSRGPFWKKNTISWSWMVVIPVQSSHMENPFYNWNILEQSRASFSHSQELLVTIVEV